MAYLNGFNYVSGPQRFVYSTVSSTATFRAGNPVQLGLGRAIREHPEDSTGTVFFGIAQNDAANSLAGRSGKCLVLVPEDTTVFAVKVATGIGGSEISIGQHLDITKSGNHFRPAASDVTPWVVVVGDQDGNAINSDDSSMFVSFLAQRLGVYGSHQSQRFLA
jgi:hypothetical protein